MEREFNLPSILRKLRSTLSGRQPAWVWSIVVFDIILLGLCFIHLPSFLNRAQPPFDAGFRNNRVTVRSILNVRSAADLHKGDILLEWDGFPVTMLGAIEFMSDLSSVGKDVQFTIEREGQVREVTARMIPAVIPVRFVAITFFMGCTIWLIGIFVLLSRPYDRTGRVIHWGLIAFAVNAMITLGKADSAALETILSRITFFVSYPACISFFLLFTTLYPTPKPGSFTVKALLTFTPAVAVTALMTIFHLRALRTMSIIDYSNFQTSFDIFHIILILYAVLGIINIVLSYRHAKTTEECSRLKWIIWGFSVGLLPFIVLCVLPQLFGESQIISEEYATIFFLAIPFSFAISFIRYRMLDIDFIINRTVMYAIFSTFIIIVAFLIALLLVSLVQSKEDFGVYVLVVLITFIVALFAAPLRKAIQHLMDQRFFAARASFRSALLSITEEIRNSLTSSILYQRLITRLPEVIPAEGIAVYRYHNGGLLFQISKGEIRTRRFDLSNEEARYLAAKPCIMDYAGESEEKKSCARLLQALGFSLCGPLATESGELLGVVCLNPRTRGERFSEEEVDLIVAVCSQASEVLGRLLLQEQIFRKEQEKKVLQELSDMKSFFVSSVSHELRNPLTSIRLGAEALRSGTVRKRRKQSEYLRIIEGESNRLSRLIGNVLDFSKIERGSRSYTFKPLRLERVVRQAAAMMKYEVRKEKGTLKLRLPRTLNPIEGDADALQQVLINLISNALKYSVPPKEVSITLTEKANQLTMIVADNGVGIPESAQTSIFEPFYQVREGKTRGTGGAGLGLAIVRHIVDAHHATITVESAPGKGSRFIILFSRFAGHQKGKP